MRTRAAASLCVSMGGGGGLHILSRNSALPILQIPKHPQEKSSHDVALLWTLTWRSLTPSQQAEAPEAPTAVIKRRKQQGIEVHRLHQEPEKIRHYTVVTEDHRCLTGKLDGKKHRKEKKNTERTGAVVGVVIREQSCILYEHRHSSQDKCDEELNFLLASVPSRPVMTSGFWSQTSLTASPPATLTSGMSSSTLQAMWYGGKCLDQPPLVQLRLTEPEVKGQDIKRGRRWQDKLFGLFPQLLHEASRQLHPRMADNLFGKVERREEPGQRRWMSGVPYPSQRNQDLREEQKPWSEVKLNVEGSWRPSVLFSLQGASSGLGDGVTVVDAVHFLFCDYVKNSIVRSVAGLASHLLPWEWVYTGLAQEVAEVQLPVEEAEYLKDSALPLCSVRVLSSSLWASVTSSCACDFSICSSDLCSRTLRSKLGLFGLELFLKACFILALWFSCSSRFDVASESFAAMVACCRLSSNLWLSSRNRFSFSSTVILVSSSWPRSCFSEALRAASSASSPVLCSAISFFNSSFLFSVSSILLTCSLTLPSSSTRLVVSLSRSVVRLWFLASSCCSVLQLEVNSASFLFSCSLRAVTSASKDSFKPPAFFCISSLSRCALLFTSSTSFSFSSRDLWRSCSCLCRLFASFSLTVKAPCSSLRALHCSSTLASNLAFSLDADLTNASSFVSPCFTAASLTLSSSSSLSACLFFFSASATASIFPLSASFNLSSKSLLALLIQNPIQLGQELYVLPLSSCQLFLKQLYFSLPGYFPSPKSFHLSGQGIFSSLQSFNISLQALLLLLGSKGGIQLPLELHNYAPELSSLLG
ncbi:hypothetical protein FQN60_013357 [Etheostoma spectabile]|uniref:Uncharacterized protein n=1 Tax=Etheostoma spectabile TaxID=54343 RepID=A0A5J5D5J9_9PERO|nr:hypothetical protein FQN60_013357 [Etheostoma spectabile]